MTENERISDPAQREQADLARKAKARARIVARREAVLSRADAGSAILDQDDWLELDREKGQDHYVRKGRLVGLALSGGGIRSATLSLGLVEALASRGRFYGIDMISTVSGGGYLGSFLRSLYIPREGDGNGDYVTDRVGFADATLCSLPDQQYFRAGHSPFVAAGKTIKNPLWWLRENGRYLAPGGMSAYGYALTAMVRNWATLVVFLLAVGMLVFALLQMALIALSALAAARAPVALAKLFVVVHDYSLHTPLAPVLLAMALLGIILAASYWMLIPLPFPTAGDERARRVAARRIFYGLTGAVGFGVLVGLALALGLVPDDEIAQGWAYGLIAAAAVMTLTALWALVASRTGTQDLRRLHTEGHAAFNLFFLVFCGLTLVDGTALALREWLREDDKILSAGALSVSLASAVAFLTAKLPQWFGDKSRVLAIARRNWRGLALLGAVIILAAIALVADLLVLRLLWKGVAWCGTREWHVFIPVMGLVLLITALLASSAKLPNLLALTPFYGARLTRAYLGGSNVRRLSTDRHEGVNQGMAGDDLPFAHYMDAEGPAPLHFINVTRNRTTGQDVGTPEVAVEHDDPFISEDPDDPRGRLAAYESSLTLHDRHGDRMVFGPFGVRIGAEFIATEDLVDPPSLGLLCAISGAAVGAGMGRHTSLGTAMAATLANLRIGYWWRQQTRDSKKAARAWLPGLYCLWAELLGRFGIAKYWFLSDGGHSENSGVLSLLERGCRFIIAADNAQDPDYSFADLEILVRTARTDIGMEVTVVDPEYFPASIKPKADLFFNGRAGDWRTHAKSPGSPAFALLLKAVDIPVRVGGEWRRRKESTSYIVWLKPRLMADLPTDIATFAELNRDFPQQSTAKQFFDEAQWESYRRLGFEMGRRLFRHRDDFAEHLPYIFLK